MPTIPEPVGEAWSHRDDAQVRSRTGRERHDRNRPDLARATRRGARGAEGVSLASWTKLPERRRGHLVKQPGIAAMPGRPRVEAAQE